MIEIQRISNNSTIPDDITIQQWVELTLNACDISNKEICIRIVEEDEMKRLNNAYRKKDQPTNVLSFPAEVPDFCDEQILGDIVICAEVIEQQALAQNKSFEAHWAHMIIHGCLHLLGHDHQVSDQAKKMEEIEVSLLKKLKFNNPYEEQHDHTTK